MVQATNFVIIMVQLEYGKYKFLLNLSQKRKWKLFHLIVVKSKVQYGMQTLS